MVEKSSDWLCFNYTRQQTDMPGGAIILKGTLILHHNTESGWFRKSFIKHLDMTFDHVINIEYIYSKVKCSSNQ